MRRLRLVLAAGALTAAFMVPSAAVPATAGAQTVTVSGSTTVYPLAVSLARAYNRRTGTRFRIVQGGSDVGVADAAAGRVTLGMSSRDPKGGDPGGITFYRVARDAVCLVTNRSNNVGSLNRSQVQALYSGSASTFPNGRPVSLIARTAPSGTQDAFQKLFLDPVRQSSSARLVASSGLVVNAVRGNPNAIGYVSLAFARGLNVVRFNGVGCTLRAAQSGQYPGSRNLYFVARGRARGRAAGFINFARSRAAAPIVAREFVPLR